MRIRWLGDISGSRDNNLNLIRALAASAVIVAHAWPITRGEDGVQPLALLLGYELGTLSVYVFFCISGFLIARSFERQRCLLHWAAARALRLLPGLVVMLALTAFVIGPLVTVLPVSSYFAHPETYTYFLRNLSLTVRQSELPGVFVGQPVSEVNGSLWSLSYEVLCYGAVMLMGLVGAFRSWLPLVGSFGVYAGACLAVALLPRDLVPNEIRTLLSLGFIFGIGVAFYIGRNWIPLSSVLLAALICATLTLRETPLYRPALVLALSYGTFVLAYLPGGFIRRYNELGDLSYGLYIYGWPVQQLAVLSFGTMGPLTNIALSLPIALALAWLSWTLVERPALALVPHSDPFLKPRAADQLPAKAEAALVTRAPWLSVLIKAGFRTIRVRRAGARSP